MMRMCTEMYSLAMCITMHRDKLLPFSGNYFNLDWLRLFCLPLGNICSAPDSEALVQQIPLYLFLYSIHFLTSNNKHKTRRLCRVSSVIFKEKQTDCSRALLQILNNSCWCVEMLMSSSSTCGTVNISSFSYRSCIWAASMFLASQKLV